MKNNNEVQIFKNEHFGILRCLMIDGEPWFVGKDVATVLGYANASKAVSAHCKHIRKEMIAHSQNGKMVKTQTSLINEGDLYRLIISSKLPNAEKFESWVMDEVLPHIRKYGYYAEGETLEEELDTIKLGMQKQQDEQKGVILKQDYHDHVIKSYQYIINQQQSMINKLINNSNCSFGNPFAKYIEPMKLYSIEDLIYELNCNYGIIISDYTVYSKLVNDKYIKYNDVLKYFEPLNNNSKVFVNPNNTSQIFFSKEFYEELKEYFININSRPLIYD